MPSSLNYIGYGSRVPGMRNIKEIETAAGQRIMAGFEGTELNGDLRFLIDTIRIGGLILFSRNITGRDQLENLCKGASEYALMRGLPELLIAIDQEGGTVARLKAPDFTEFPGAPFIETEADAAMFARVTARELREMGINMNMAPVMDVAPENVDSIMSRRIFSRDPRTVSKIGTIIINGLQRRGIMPVAKHFPGIGRTTLDSHFHLPDLETDLEDLEAFDLLPFKAAIENDVAGIMLSHVRYISIDPEWPASLSPEIAVNLLRNKMRYNGVVFTDDLEMKAISNHYEIPAIAGQVLEAQVDIALACKSGSVIEKTFESMCRLMKDSRQLAEKAEFSIPRIANLKSRLSKVDDLAKNQD